MARQTTNREDEDLTSIVKDNIIIQIVFDDILYYVQDNIEPDDIYDRGELDDWAIAHGYIKENK